MSQFLILLESSWDMCTHMHTHTHMCPHTQYMHTHAHTHTTHAHTTHAHTYAHAHIVQVEVAERRLGQLLKVVEDVPLMTDTPTSSSSSYMHMVMAGSSMFSRTEFQFVCCLYIRKVECGLFIAWKIWASYFHWFAVKLVPNIGSYFKSGRGLGGEVVGRGVRWWGGEWGGGEGV